MGRGPTAWTRRRRWPPATSWPSEGTGRGWRRPPPCSGSCWRPPVADGAGSYPARPGAARLPGMRGDMVEVLVDTGDGSVRGFEIVATRSGRRVEVTTSRTMVEVAEGTRPGQPVRTARFLSSRVVAIVEHPYAAGRPAARP